MRKALVVGIDYYEKGNPLRGCVDDAHSVKTVLERNSDGTINFDVRIMTASGPGDVITRKNLKDAVVQLFADDSEIALFYFAGHGFVEAAGGYLITSEASEGDEGVSLSDIIQSAHTSPAKNRIIILDSCHSGVAAAKPKLAVSATPASSELTEGLTILTASTENQYAKENDEGGIFTSLFVDALMGAASNLVGDITPGSVYAHIDQSLGSWDNQRPVFKTNVKSFVSLRKVNPPISLGDLQRLAELFPEPGYQLKLNPSFEPEDVAPPPHIPDPKNTEIFSVLQKLNRVNLVVPVGASHMYHAAMESKSCKLTVLGEHYRRLVERKRI